MLDLLKTQAITSIVLASIYAFYSLFLRHETFFRANRFFLIAALMISFAVPFVQFEVSSPQVQTINKTEFIRTARTVFVSGESVVPEMQVAPTPRVVTSVVTVQPQANINYTDIFCYLYLIGLASFALKFVFNLFKIYSIKRNAEWDSRGYYLIPADKSSFSFMNSIYISTGTSERERQAILAHENVHLELRHSLDTLLIAAAKCLQWFNPVIYFLEKALSEVHEYQADNASSRNSKTEYMELLVNQTIGAQLVDLGNNFNSSTLLKRLKMLNKSKSKPIMAAKYLLMVIPIGISLFLFSCKDDTKPSTTQNNEITIPIVKDYKDYGPADSMPVPLIGWDAYRQLIKSETRTPEEIKDKDIAAQIFIRYVIDSLGNMVDLRYDAGKRTGGDWTKKGVGYGMDAEAIRVIKKIAQTVKWQPAMYKGRPVNSEWGFDLTIGDPILFGYYHDFSGSVEGHPYPNKSVSMISIKDPCPRASTKEISFFSRFQLDRMFKYLFEQTQYTMKRDTGSVDISFAIDQNGNAQDCKIEKPSGSNFDQAILKSVQMLSEMRVKEFNHQGKRYTIHVAYKNGRTWQETQEPHAYDF